jgi:hypothetical protein
MGRFRLLLGAVVIACVATTAPLKAVGTLTVTTADVGGGVTLYTLAWTSTAGGGVSGNAFSVRRGRILQVKFMPNTAGTQPTDLYDITLVDEESIDLLNGQAANLSNATGLYLQFNPPLWHDETQDLDLVVANAGAAKTGTVYLWVAN